MNITKVCNHAICKIRNKNIKCIRKQKLPTMHQKPSNPKPESNKLPQSLILEKYKNEKEIKISKYDFEENQKDNSFGVETLKYLQNESKSKIDKMKRKKKKKPIVVSEKIDGSKLYKSDNRKFFYYRKPSIELKDFLIDNEDKNFLDYGVYCLKKKMNRFFLEFVRDFVRKEEEKGRLEEIRKLEKIENKRKLELEKIRFEKEEKTRLEKEQKEKLAEKNLRLEKIKSEMEEKIKLVIQLKKESLKSDKQKTNLSSDFKTTDNENTIDFASSNSQKQNINNKKINYKKLLDLSLKEEDENRLENEEDNKSKSENDGEDNILLISTNEKINDNYFDLEKSNNDLENLKNKVTNIDYKLRMKKITNTESKNKLRDSLQQSVLKIETEREKKAKTPKKKSPNPSEIQEAISNTYFSSLIPSPKKSFDFQKKDDLEKKEYVKKMRIGTFSRGSNAFQIYQKQQEEKKRQLNKRRSSLNERRVNRRSFIDNISKEFFINKKKSELLRKEEEVKREERNEGSESSDSSFDSSDEEFGMEKCKKELRNSLERGCEEGEDYFFDGFGVEGRDLDTKGDERIGNVVLGDCGNVGFIQVENKNLFLYDDCEDQRGVKDDEVFNLFNKNLEDDCKRDASPMFFEKKNEEGDVFGKKGGDEDFGFELEDDQDLKDEFFSGFNKKRKSRTEKVNEFENLIKSVKKKRKSERKEKKKNKIEEESKNIQNQNNKNNTKINENKKDSNQNNNSNFFKENLIKNKSKEDSESESEKSSENMNNLKENILSTKIIHKIKVTSLKENPSISEIESTESISEKDNEKKTKKNILEDEKFKKGNSEKKESINLKNYKKKKTDEEIKIKKEEKINISNSEESSDISSFDDKSKDLEKKKNSIITEEDFENKNMRKIQAVLKKLTENLDSDKILMTIKEEDRYSMFAKNETKKTDKIFLEKLEEESSESESDGEFNLNVCDNSLKKNNLDFFNKKKEVFNINLNEKFEKKNLIEKDLLKKHGFEENDVKNKEEEKKRKFNENIALEKLVKKNINKIYKNIKKDVERKIEFNKNLELSKINKKENYKNNLIDKIKKKTKNIYKEDQKLINEENISELKQRKNSLNERENLLSNKITLNFQKKKIFLEQEKTESDNYQKSPKKDEKMIKIRKTLKNTNLIYKEDKKIKNQENIPELKQRKNSLENFTENKNSQNTLINSENKKNNFKSQNLNIDKRKNYIQQDKTEIEDSSCSESEKKKIKNNKMRASIKNYNNIISEKEKKKSQKIIITIRENSLENMNESDMSLSSSPKKKYLKTNHNNLKKNFMNKNEINFKRKKESRMVNKKIEEIKTFDRFEKEEDYDNNLEDMESIENFKINSNLKPVFKNNGDLESFVKVERKNSLENVKDDFLEEMENLRTSNFSKKNIPEEKSSVNKLNSKKGRFSFKEKKVNLFHVKENIEKEEDYKNENNNKIEETEKLIDLRRSSRLTITGLTEIKIKNENLSKNTNIINRRNSLFDSESESFDINEEYNSLNDSNLKTSQRTLIKKNILKGNKNCEKRKSKLIIKEKINLDEEVQEDLEKEEYYVKHRNYSFNGYKQEKSELTKLFFSTLNPETTFMKKKNSKNNSPLKTPQTQKKSPKTEKSLKIPKKDLQKQEKETQEKTQIKDWQNYKEKFSYKMMTKMNKILEKRPYMTQESCFTFLQKLMSQMVKKDFIIFLLNLDEDEIEGILTIQRFWRKRTNVSIIRKILGGHVYFKRETRLAKVRLGGSVFGMKSTERLEEERRGGDISRSAFC